MSDLSLHRASSLLLTTAYKATAGMETSASLRTLQSSNSMQAQVAGISRIQREGR
jgi:hypothetical protein